MSDVDQLIDELFPNESNVLNSSTHNSQIKQEVPASQANWDTSDDEKEHNGENKILEEVKPIVVENKQVKTETEVTKEYFDDSEEDNFESEKVVIPSLTVPFPFLKHDVGVACKFKCFVTNKGLDNIRHPSVAQLLIVAQAKYNALITMKQLLERKGAFHAFQPKIGNGAIDKCNGNINDNCGGCPFIICRKCNYAVIRLQGASWQDEGGKIDLYLTVRNYYPDWSRLASSFPVGQSKNLEQVKVIKANSACAAYCCQCSWLTVKSSQEIIETRLSDAAEFVGKEDSCCFATQLPLIPGEKRRPPLWVCRGHIPQF